MKLRGHARDPASSSHSCCLAVGEQLTVDTRDKNLRRRFNEAAQRREAELTETFAQAGVVPLSLSTEKDLVRAIFRFATQRKRMRRQQR